MVFPPSPSPTRSSSASGTKRAARTRQNIIAAVVYAAVAALCTRIPLLDHPGFEFSFFLALTATVVAGFLTIARIRPSYRSLPGHGPFSPIVFWWHALRVNLFLLLIPLGIIVLNGVRVPLCNVGEGLAFFLLIPVVTVVFSVTLGLFCVVHYRRSRVMFTLLFGLTIVYVIGLGYFTPPIDSYNFFYGYFPGLSYDELLPLDGTLALFRLLTLGAAGLLLWWSVLLSEHTQPTDGAIRKGVTLLRVLLRRHPAVAAALLVAGGLLYSFRCELGWEATGAYVRATLGGEYETEHFSIVYDSSVTRTEDIVRIAAEHEFRLSQVLDAFALTKVGRIRSYVYPSARVKRRLIGAGETELAKPWSREIHLTAQSVDEVLKHELVHVVAAPFGVPLVGASLSTGLVEGLAVAVEGSWGYRTPAQYASALRKAGIAPDIQDLMSLTGFAAHSSTVSYLFAGAFTGFLIERYGMRPVMQVYGSGDYTSAFGSPLPALIGAWERSLDSVAVGEQERAAVDVYFRRPPIFGRTCPREYARRISRAREEMAGHRYEEAREQYDGLYNAYGGYDALAGLLVSTLRSRHPDRVVAHYDSLLTHDPIPRRYLPLALTAGDAAWVLGDYSRARLLFQSLRDADIAPSLTEAAAMRIWALTDGDATQPFAQYFQADVPDTVRALMLRQAIDGPGDALARYLLGRVFFRLGRYPQSAYMLQQAGAIDRDTLLEARRCVAIGDALERAGAYQQARRWYWVSLNADARPHARRVVDDRIARCDFLETFR